LKNMRCGASGCASRRTITLATIRPRLPATAKAEPGRARARHERAVADVTTPHPLAHRRGAGSAGSAVTIRRAVEDEPVSGVPLRRSNVAA
jgi:hypothetical protein